MLLSGHPWQPHNTAEHKLWMPLLQEEGKHLGWFGTDSCPAVPRSLMSKDSSSWFLVCSAFVATHPPLTLPILFLPTGCRERAMHESMRTAELTLLTPLDDSSLFPNLRGVCCLHTLPQTAVRCKDRTGAACQDSRESLLLPASSTTSSHCSGLQL